MHCSVAVLAVVFATSATIAALPAAAQADAYKVVSTAKVGGEGYFDYVTADPDGRRLYVARAGTAGHVAVYNLDDLKPVGDIAGVNAHGATVNTKYGHGFTASKPVNMFDAKTLAILKTIDVQGNPDGYLNDPVANRVYILSHAAPNVTVLDAKDGAILGTIDLGGAPEQAVLDGKGHLFIDLEDKAAIAVVDSKAMTLTGKYDLTGKGDECTGLAMDTKNGILFAACRNPQTMVILSAADGKIITTLPIGKGTDGAVFNAATMEAFSSQGDGTLTIVKENSPTSFAVEQTLATATRAKTLTLDPKTNRIFLIAADFNPVPPAEPGQKPGRPTMVPDSFKILTVGK